MKSFRKRPRSEWRQVVNDWKESGLSVSEFCRRQGLQEGRFYSWRKRFGLGVNVVATAENKQPAIKFLPVQVKEFPTTVNAKGESPTQRIEVFLSNGSIVRFSGELSDAKLASIMSLASGATC